jgi:uncharacterized protein YecE (DUF72 family)
MQTNPEASPIDRLRGSPRIYYSPYERETLSRMAKRLVGDAAAEVETWCIFDNTAAFATGDALTTKRLVKTVAESGNAE